MRNPIASLGPEAVTPVDRVAGTSPREAATRDRTFAELLAEAEAVQDHIEIRRRATGLRGVVQDAVQGAAGFVARQTPWLGLPLLVRRHDSLRQRRGAN